LSVTGYKNRPAATGDYYAIKGMIYIIFGFSPVVIYQGNKEKSIAKSAPLENATWLG